MLQKLNLIMNQTLPATYDDSLSYYEALSKICYEVNEIIDKINADEALIRRQIRKLSLPSTLKLLLLTIRWKLTRKKSNC